MLGKNIKKEQTYKTTNKARGIKQIHKHDQTLNY